MALNAYLTIVGESQDQIQGSVTQSGREDTIEISETKHLVYYPLDAVTGAKTTSKKHKPITITKDIDRSSPLLYQMWANNEICTEWILRFYQPNIDGTEVQFYTIELENASIISIRFEHPNTKDLATQIYPEREQITFDYSKIIITHEESGNSAEEDITASTS